MRITKISSGQKHHASWGQNGLDKENLAQIEKIIKIYGYPGKKLVAHYSDVGFLVIRHSSLEVQERYLPMLKKAADKDGKITIPPIEDDSINKTASDQPKLLIQKKNSQNNREYSLLIRPF